jgi:ABC-type Fe3+-hydroxamate transport system substrate-binding protein
MTFKKEFVDQMGNVVILQQPPKRIVSLVPSQTELLFYLGLKDEVVGITKFCIHPNEMFRSKTRVGGTKKYDFDKIRALNPDLIIGNKEENDQEQIEQLMKLYPVWMSDIKTLPDAMEMISMLGTIIQKEDLAKKLVRNIENAFVDLKEFSPNKKVSVAYFIWKNPYMCAAADTFIDEMLQYCGMENIFKNSDSRYPIIEMSDLIKYNPQCILLSSEPYPFKESDINELQSILPNATIRIVDGEMFSWYGSRLLAASVYLKSLLNTL